MKEIENYPNYSINEKGEIYSKVSKRCLKPYSNGKGYLVIRLINEEGKRAYKLHRLLAINFIDNPNNKLFVNHKNGIKNDNNLNNLEWVTHSENIKHAYLNNLIKK